MTDLERIARALVQRTAEFYGDPLPENPNLAFTMVLAAAALAAMPEIAAMREEIERLNGRCIACVRPADHAEACRVLAADRDHWKAECERLRERIAEMNDDFREISDRADRDMN